MHICNMNTLRSRITFWVLVIAVAAFIVLNLLFILFF